MSTSRDACKIKRKISPSINFQWTKLLLFYKFEGKKKNLTSKWKSMILHPRATTEVSQYHHAGPPSRSDLLLFTVLPFRFVHCDAGTIRSEICFPVTEIERWSRGQGPNLAQWILMLDLQHEGSLGRVKH